MKAGTAHGAHGDAIEIAAQGRPRQASRKGLQFVESCTLILNHGLASMLTAEGKRSLRARAHHLKPVVLIGQHGVSDAVIAEISIALDAHELIKIRFRSSEREVREAEVARICDTLAAEFVSGIGGTAVLYRHRVEQPKRKAKAKSKSKVKPRTRMGSVRNRNRGRDEI